jgi:hypothetical protein
MRAVLLGGADRQDGDNAAAIERGELLTGIVGPETSHLLVLAVKFADIADLPNRRAASSGHAKLYLVEKQQRKSSAGQDPIRSSVPRQNRIF